MKSQKDPTVKTQDAETHRHEESFITNPTPSNALGKTNGGMILMAVLALILLLSSALAGCTDSITTSEEQTVTIYVGSIEEDDRAGAPDSQEEAVDEFAFVIYEAEGEGDELSTSTWYERVFEDLEDYDGYMEIYTHSYTASLEDNLAFYVSVGMRGFDDATQKVWYHLGDRHYDAIYINVLEWDGQILMRIEKIEGD